MWSFFTYLRIIQKYKLNLSLHLILQINIFYNLTITILVEKVWIYFWFFDNTRAQSTNHNRIQTIFIVILSILIWSDHFFHIFMDNSIIIHNCVSKTHLASMAYPSYSNRLLSIWLLFDFCNCFLKMSILLATDQIYNLDTYRHLLHFGCR